VTLVATVRDQEFEPLRASSVKARVSAAGREEVVVELAAVPGSPGRFRGEFAPEVRGDYTAWLRDESGQTGAECPFSVRIPRREFERTQMDLELLRNMAAASADGRFVPLAKVKDLPDRVPKRTAQFARRHSEPLWDNWRLFVLFAVLVVTEWALRKRVNLL
jgi:hypothetical protein